MEQDERLLLGSSFGAAAAAYAEHRPDYAQSAVRWALEPAPGLRGLDLGAGTGKLTATLVALGADVIAVEPDPAMLAELRRALPDVRALPGSAEDPDQIGHALGVPCWSVCCRADGDFCPRSEDHLLLTPTGPPRGNEGRQ